MSIHQCWRVYEVIQRMKFGMPQNEGATKTVNLMGDITPSYGILALHFHTHTPIQGKMLT